MKPKSLSKLARQSLRVTLVLFGLSSALACFQAQGWPPTFGFEFEFTRSDINFTPKTGDQNGLNGAEEGAAAELAKAVEAACAGGGCTVKEVQHKYGKAWVVTFEDGFWFRISFDPSCVEIQTRALTLEGLKGNQDRMQKMIFDVAKARGFVTDPKGGNGHLNMGGRSAFSILTPPPQGGAIKRWTKKFTSWVLGRSTKNSRPVEDVRLFARFVADYSNNPELAMGILGVAGPNCPILLGLGEDQQEAFRKLLQDVEAGKVDSLRSFSERMVKEVYTRSEIPEWGAPDHYQAIGLDKLQNLLSKGDLPFEVRAIFPQISAENAVLLAELFQRRIEFIATRNEPAMLTDRKLPPPESRTLSNKEVAGYFFKYLIESGFQPEDWHRMKTLIRAGAQSALPRQFRDLIKQSALNSGCETLFGGVL